MIESLLRQVDTARVLAASAVMQMDLSNVNELLVLQNLSHFAARQATEPGRELSSSALKRLLAADEVGGPAVLGDLDPFEGFPVVEVPVPPRRYLVLEGMATDSAEIAARLLRSIFASRQSTFPAQYRVAVSAAARFLLGLSDSLARQFGRSLDDRAPSLTRRVTVPSGSRIATLAQRLVFSPGALFAGRSISEVQFLTDSLVWRHGEIGPISPDGLGGSVDDALNAQAEPQPDDIFAMMTDAAADADSTLLVRPIVATHLGLVVASPTSLAASLRHLVVVLAQQHNCVDQLVDALTESAVTDLRFLLEPMTDLPLRTVPTTAAETGRGMKPADDSAAEPSGVRGFTEPRRGGGVAEGPGNSRDVESDQVGVRGLVRLTAPFDEDKALDVRLTVDTLDHYDASTVWGSSTTPQVELAPLGLPPERVLVIDTHLGVGRDFLYLGGDEDSPGLFASLSDMATLMLAPGTDRLTLWYFAKALHRLHRSTRVFTFSVVDTFAIYRDAHESFYLSDDAAPQLLNVAVGTGQDLRYEAFHAAGDPFALYDAGLSRALGCHAGASPVTAILADPNVRFARLGKLTAWARVQLLDTEDSGEARGTGLLGTPVGVLAESITYWLWQIHRAQPLLVLAPEGISELQVEATLSRLSGEGETAEAGPPLHGWVVHEPDIAPCNPIVRGAKSVAFAIHGWLPATNAAGDPPNALDRQLVGALIDGLVSLNAQPEEWPASRRATLMDVVAPPGLKVMTRVLRAGDSLLLWPVGVPSARHVSEAVTADVLDRLGEHLVAAGFRVGPIARPNRTGFLNNDVTGYLIAWLEQEISRLDAPSAVQRLILMYEALLHESADDLDQLPTRIACFGDAAADVKRIQRNRRTSMTTSIALRYLIEYVSASAPSGTGVLTVEKYDLLLALAAEIVNKGMLSDTLRYGLADNAISILPSGRLGVQREQEAYSEALAAFSESLAQQTVQQAADLAAPTRRQPHSGRVGGPSHNERSDDAAKSGSPLADLDVLATAEYGFSYSQIVAACGALLDAASERGYENVATFDVSTVRRVIGTATGLGEDATDSMMTALSIAPLDDYWARGADAYPWRFNRDRSYLRRPLIRMPATGANDAVLLFGLRSTWLAPRHWLERHLSGRLRARSDAMRRALAVQRKVKGEEFEAAVELELRRAGFPQTRRRFTRAGSLNLHDVNGEDLGDVDVLLVSRQGLLVAVEAKSLEAARTPVELAHEVETLTSGDKAATIRIARRADALAQHLPEVEEALGLPHEARRRVVPLVVTDVALLGNYLSTSTVAIVALDALVDALTAIDAERRRR